MSSTTGLTELSATETLGLAVDKIVGNLKIIYGKLDQYTELIGNMSLKMDGMAAYVEELETRLAHIETVMDPATGLDSQKLRDTVGEILKRDFGKLGPVGPRGEKGEVGDRGAVGQCGPRGEVGERGPRGEIGERGPSGAIGLKGADGCMGLAGPDGRPGADGRDGKDGLDGKSGKDGRDGAPGAVGAPGPRGPRGLPGRRGNSGPGYIPTAADKQHEEPEDEHDEA